MKFETILYETNESIATVTLNRPEKLNAWTIQMRDEMQDAIDMANADKNVSALIFTGAGRGFCAGADIKASFKARLDGERDEEAEAKKRAERPWVDQVRSSKPMIAAVNGPAVGVGATMILSMDYILASDRARFSIAFARMGLVVELASSHFLVQRMGFGAASEVALSGRMIEAPEAVELKLADKLVPHEQLMEHARGIAGSFAANPDTSLRRIKAMLTKNGSDNDLTAVVSRELAALQECYATAEHKETVAAFMEKRKPNFRG